MCAEWCTYCSGPTTWSPYRSVHRQLQEELSAGVTVPLQGWDTGSASFSVSSGLKPVFSAQTVCTYWLKGLCMKGDTCGFLHEFNPERMPVCRSLLKYGICKEPDCPYKHSLTDIKVCHRSLIHFGSAWLEYSMHTAFHIAWLLLS